MAETGNTNAAPVKSCPFCAKPPQIGVEDDDGMVMCATDNCVLEGVWIGRKKWDARADTRAVPQSARDRARAQSIVREWTEHDLDEHYNSDYMRDLHIVELEERIAAVISDSPAPVEGEALAWSKDFPKVNGWYWLRGWRAYADLPIKVDGNHFWMMYEFSKRHKSDLIDGESEVEFRGPISADAPTAVPADVLETLNDCYRAVSALPDDALGRDSHEGHFYAHELLAKIEKAIKAVNMVPLTVGSEVPDERRRISRAIENLRRDGAQEYNRGIQDALLAVDDNGRISAECPKCGHDYGADSTGMCWSGRLENTADRPCDCKCVIAPAVPAAPVAAEAMRRAVGDAIRTERRKYTVDTEGSYPLLVSVLNDVIATVESIEIPTPADAATIHPDDLQDSINKFLLENYACTIDHPAMHVLKEFVRWHPKIPATAETCDKCGHNNVNVKGFCDETVPIPNSVRAGICLCHCVFPARAGLVDADELALRFIQDFTKLPVDGDAHRELVRIIETARTSQTPRTDP